MTDQSTSRSTVAPLRAVVRYVGYKGWWWHIEDAEGHLVNFIATRVRDMTEPDGVALRGRAWTQRGARRKASTALRQAESHLPPEGGWKPQEFASTDGRGWQAAT